MMTAAVFCLREGEPGPPEGEPEPVQAGGGGLNCPPAILAKAGGGLMKSVDTTHRNHASLGVD